MDRRKFMYGAGALAAGLAGLGATFLAAAAAPSNEKEDKGGMTLEAALHARKSQRAYAEKDLPEPLLLHLLWAAFGVNRADGRRTAPSAMNRQEISIYVAKKDGLFLYDAHNKALVRKAGGDLRAQTGTQSYVATAPANLVYVADMNSAAGNTAESRLLSAGLDTGFISQNVYLFCTASGLATVARTGLDAEALAKAMELPAGRRVIMAQCVGYPKEG